MFISKYKNFKPQTEAMKPDTIVDPAGYVSPKKRIENLIRAGERLDQFRRENYDLGYEDEDDGTWEDPMRQPGLDLADVHRIRQAVRSRMQSASAKTEEEPKKDSEAMEKEATQPGADAAAPPKEDTDG